MDEKDELEVEDELTMLETSTDVKVKLLEGEVKKLKGLLNRMKKKVKNLEQDRKDLEELVEHQEDKIATVEDLREDVRRLEDMNKLMWRRSKDY